MGYVVEVRMESQEYIKLKEEIVRCAGSGDLLSTKQQLQQIIFQHEGERLSKRSLSRVSCLGDLFKLLEDRDYLNPNNVDYLLHVASALTTSKNEALGLIKTYKKLCGITEPPTCEICSLRDANDNHVRTTNLSSSHGEKTFANPMASHSTGIQQLPVASHPVPHNSEDSIVDLLAKRPRKLTEAIEALSARLDFLWPVVLRELGLKEGHIMKVREKFSSDKQARQALDYWSITDKDASVEKLHAALSSSECARRGLNPGFMECDRYLRLLL